MKRKSERTGRVTIVDLIHARIVYDSKRKQRRAAKKGGLGKSRKARLGRIEREIEEEWRKRDRAS